MSAKNKVRGTVLEMETVKDAEAYGLETRRAPCSKGSMLGKGYHDQIDILIEKYTIQCKRLKKPPSKVFLELLPETHKTDDVPGRLAPSKTLCRIRDRCRSCLTRTSSPYWDTDWPCAARVPR